jgi:hypothetical protein
MSENTMSRIPNTDAAGKPFDATMIEAVWEKARVSAEYRPLRVESFGSLIWKDAYGNTNSKLGWEIDHIKPVTKGGGDNLENLQLLQWENNRRKGESLINGEHQAASGLLRQGIDRIIPAR